MFRFRTFVVFATLVAAVTSAAVFQDQIDEQKVNAPVFQDQVPREGYVEISPGVYAPKVGVPPLKPRKPFEFDDDDMLKREMWTIFEGMLVPESTTIPIAALDEFVNKVMNPSDLKLYDVEADLIATRIKEFRIYHGMADPDDQRPLYYGFLVRGKPLQFFKKLAADLLELRKATRASLLKTGKKAEVDAVEGAPVAEK